MVALDHPDWLARVGGKPVATDMDGVALCLADPRVRAWILAQVDRLAAEGSLDWLVHDFTVITGCDDAGTFPPGGRRLVGVDGRLLRGPRRDP